VAAAASDSHIVVDLHRQIVYSEVETSGAAPEPARRFTVDLGGPRVLYCADDLVGPRVLYCADEAVDLLLRSGGSHHVEFKSVEGGSLLYWEGCLYPVPDSRQAITTLKLKEKNILFRFFKLVQAHIAAALASGDETGQGDASARILEEDLDLPFVEFLRKQGASSQDESVRATPRD
jgi:Rab proteins geranylgeranyltransferase component A